jgi:HSP20 family protein
MTDRLIAGREAKTPDTRDGQHVQTAPAGEAETIFVPDVDIHEDNDCIRLEADMPGVDQESVDVSVENGVLTIEGRTRAEGLPGYELLGQEYGVGRYRRDFTLSDAVDAEGIKGRVRQGVLELTLPKHARVRSRKIAIKA